MSDNKFHTGRVLENMEKLKNELPVIMANQAKNFFTGSWKNDGWEGAQWETPKRKIEGTDEYKYPKKGASTRHTRATLVKSGALRRAVGMSIRNVSFERTTLIVDLPYAAIHNEGGQGLAFGKYSFKMPKRQYMGDSPQLRGMQVEKIKSYIDKVWNK
jgi:phage gpG-like protein